MYDLLGMSFSTTMNARISLDAFQLSGKKNPDGWGADIYERLGQRWTFLIVIAIHSYYSLFQSIMEDQIKP